MADELVPSSPGEFLIYQTDDGKTRVQVRFEGETAWLSQRDMAELFQTTPQNVTIHIGSIYEEGELVEAATCKDFLQVRSEGGRQVQRSVKHYNLDVIISVGYRVKSLRGTQFRIWATQRLREYIIKGFTLDDERLKKAGGGDHFQELLERIRDIRSSERVFWRKVLDIYALSEDYDPKADTSKLFFQTVQNKMHWAISGQTAAEIVHARADASKPLMGLTSHSGSKPKKADVSIAKNYLNEEELKALNLMVSAYLDFAELQAMNRKPMFMADWITKLDDFIRMTDRQILSHAGKVSHETARLKAEAEYDKFRAAQDALPQPVDRHFEEVIDEVKRLEAPPPPAPKATKPGRKKKDGGE
ncbi:MAG: virulence RhuM family protein [Ancrocorticia sp.]